MKLLIMQFPPIFYYFLPLRLKYLTQQPVLKHPQLRSSVHVTDQDSHLYKTAGNNYRSVYFSLFCFWIATWKAELSGLNHSRNFQNLICLCSSSLSHSIGL